VQLQAEAAQQHAAGRIALANGANLLVQQAWSGVDPAAIVDSWTAQVPVAAAAITRAQYAAASTSDPYIDEFDLAGAGVEDNLVPAAFAGTASDGRSLLSLLMSPAFQALQFIAAGSHPVDALRLGGQHLGVITQTQVADAGRLADGVALTAHRRIDGYIRVVAGGACSRCAILSGKWYRWSAGFLRHPHCHCVHEPANRDVDVPSPRALYDRMSPAERSRAGWSKADQRAIDDGADLAQVTNAKRGVYTAGGKRFTTAGTTRRGLYGGYRIDPETGRLTRRARGDKAGPRMTPEQIYREASGDRDRAIRMLRENGYLTPARPALAPVGAGGAAAAASPEIAVRAALRVDSAGAVEAAFAAEARRITGREITADFAGWSVETAREHAEGVLRGLEVFPDARLDHVGPIRGIVYGSRFAEAGDGSIDFNPRWVTEDAREEYLDTLRKSAVLPDGVTRGGIPDTPAGVAIHEFGHIVDLDTLGGRIQGDVYAAVYREAAAAGVDGDVLVRERLSQYATQSVEETVAEAFADVVINGERASALSREVFDLLEAEYRRGGFAAGSGIARAFGPAEDLSRLTVVQLRALAREREVRIPSTARKADIVELLQPAGGGQIRRGIERQREIDAVSPVAERAIAVEQFIHDGGSLADAADLLDVEAEHDATIAKMLAAVRKPGTTPAAAIREIRRLAGTRGLKPISRAGASVGFNPAEHRSLGRAEIAKGTRVQVVQPGYAVTLASGERVILEKAIVAEVPAVAAAATTDLTKMTVAQLRALANERGIAVRSADRKADILTKLRAGEGPAVPPGTGPLPNRAAKTVAEIFADPYADGRTFKQAQFFMIQQHADIAAAVEGAYGSRGLKVAVTQARVTARNMQYHADVLDPKSGRKVGTITRYMERNNDTDELMAVHSFLELDRAVQGSGFAEQFNRNLYDWYRRSGVAYVDVHADIDVGGYAWATQGYEFRDRDVARDFLHNAEAALRRMRGVPVGLTEAQMIDLDRFVDDMKAGRIPISAPAIARFGRLPGQGGKKAMWPGKWLMLGSDWRGRLYM
jgi:hypothetical protein